MEQRTLYLKSQLFQSASATVFAVLDGAAVPGLPAKLAFYNPQYTCLYRGELSPEMAAVAPYLVILEKDDLCTEWILRQGWGRCWGIIGCSDGDLFALRTHFQRFVQVSHASTGKPLYFRFYDPVVLRVYLPWCSIEQRKAFFGPVRWYIAEDAERGELEKFLLVNDVLRQERISLVA